MEDSAFAVKKIINKKTERAKNLDQLLNQQEEHLKISKFTGLINWNKKEIREPPLTLNFSTC